MALRFSVLGSGSGGNCTLLVIGEGDATRRVLIDAGLSPRETARRLERFGVAIPDLDAILVTHLDGDHLRESWPRVCARNGIRMCLHRRHARHAQFHAELRDLLMIFDGGFELDGGALVQPTLLAHDDLGTVGYVIEHQGERLGLATDLGRVHPGLYEHFVDLDVLAIESNYDRRMQIESNRPPVLKRRIMGGHGHLSNEQSLEAVLGIASRSRLRHVVLLHLSRQCNDPAIIERLYTAKAPALAPRLVISSQFAPTPLLGACDRPSVRVGGVLQSTLFQSF